MRVRNNKAQTSEGYVCTPYLHDHDSVELKESWAKSKNVSEMYFVTATFSRDGKLYFTKYANHYLLAKVNDCDALREQVVKRSGDSASFVFGVNENLFERETEGKKNFVWICYTEYVDTKSAMTDIAHVISRKNRIEIASHGDIGYYCNQTKPVNFPFHNQIMIFEVSAAHGHQGMNKYCEQMQREVTRRGITLTNLMGLSILDKLK